MNVQDRTQVIKYAGIVFIGLFLLYLLIHSFSKPQPKGPPPPMVEVQKPQMKEMAEYVIQTGNTVAYQSVNLVARVEGYLDSIEFTDGAFVKKNQPLFVIEPQPYMEQVRAAQATVAAQTAAYEYSKLEYARQQQMYKQNATSLKNVEKWNSKVAESKAEVDKAVADAKNTEITYGYTHVSAPFDGRMGRHLIDAGNLVGNGKATDLATIEQINPLYVYFNLNELELIKIRNAARAKGLKPMKVAEIPIAVGMQNEEGFPHKGTLDFIDTGLNASTGTMTFRALLPNDNFDLVPGLFVQVRVPISKPTPQLTIPDTSVQYDQIGAYVLVVDKDNIVVLKRVTLGSTENGARAITKGLEPQDNVIVSGLQNAIPSHKVTLKTNQGVEQAK